MRGWNIRRAPISATELQPLGVVLRWAAGAAMIAYSVITTTIILGWLLSPLIKSQLYGIGYSYIIGLSFGIGVTLAEWVTSDEAPRVHWFLVLVLDAPFSGWQTYVWLMVIAVARLDTVTSGWIIAIGIVSALWGVFTAKLGEKLLIRRKAQTAE